MKTFRANSSQRGFTLVELMIAMLIGVFLTGGILQIFASSKQAYRLQENLSRLQENGRFAMDFITKDIRMAGFAGCASKVPLTPIVQNKSKLLAIDAGISGINDVKSTDTICDSSNYQCKLDTDLISFQSASSCGGRITSLNDAAATMQIAYPNDCNIEKGDVVIISNCSAATAFGVSNNKNTAQTVTHGGNENIVLTPANKADYKCIDNKTKLCSVFDPADSEIYASKSISYFIRTRADGVHSLWSVNGAKAGATPVELIEGIEDMQIVYGVDTDTTEDDDCDGILDTGEDDNSNGSLDDRDYVPNYYVDAQNVPATIPSNPTCNKTGWDRVVSVRITLLAATIDDGLTFSTKADGTQTSQPYTYNGKTITETSTPKAVTDRRIRREFSSTIAVRNRLP